MIITALEDNSLNQIQPRLEKIDNFDQNRQIEAILRWLTQHEWTNCNLEFLRDDSQSLPEWGQPKLGDVHIV